jgi:hypothetical protein
MDLAKGEVKKEELAKFYEKHSKPMAGISF